MTDATIIRADRWVDVEAGELRTPAVIVVEANRTQTRQIAVVERTIVAARGHILGHILGYMASVTWPRLLPGRIRADDRPAAS